MKITEIKIENFKGIKNLVFHSEKKIGVLMGHNGVGKTSFIEAIRFVLTGDAPVSYIRDGCDAAEVEVTFDDGMVISRRKTMDKTAVMVNGKVTTQKNAEALLSDRYGFSKTNLRICTSTDVLAGLSSADFGSFIKTYLPEKLTKKIVFSYLPKHTKEEEDALSRFFALQPEEFDISVLAKAYDAFYAERTDVSRKLKGAKANVERSHPDEPSRCLSDVETDIADVTKAIGAIDAAKRAMVDYDKAIVALNKYQERIALLKADIDADTSKPVDVGILERIREDKRSYTEQLGKAKAMIQLMKSDIAVFEESLSNLNKPVCPLSDLIVCTVDKSKARNSLMDIIESNRQGIKIQEDLCSSLLASIKSAEKKETDVLARDRKYSERVRKLKEYNECVKSVPFVPKKPDIVSSKELDKRLLVLKNEKTACILYDEYRHYRDEYDAVMKEYSVLNAVVKYLEPKGSVISNILEHYCSVFEDIINERAKKYKTGMLIKFFPENGMQYFVCTGDDKEYRQYDALSHGEQLVVMFLMMDMINALNNFGILILDDLNHLDKDAFGKLMEMINMPEVKDTYNNVFLACVDNDEYEKELDFLNYQRII